MWKERNSRPARASRPRLRTWPRLSCSDLDAAINDFAGELGAKDDHHASAKFRRQQVRHLGRAAIDKALS